ncbi:hypothetical protein D5R93_05830 [Actinomyces lilanjuaniae]|uniref:Hypervirulence associated protein TUDOR domain-containing protein n=1 Tax=Actinomyces lilanjuaniae TaxID=2321394 RepID=A0ABN5PPU3_9ACTO|nr:hypothetical protein [Actinomyces lilanjuaniae]AYD89688.1 hypothetical protein D5R93_05830 [Actinomyces lilanjuaniae]
MTWEPVCFSEIRVGDTVRTRDHTTGEVIAQGVVDYVTHPKEHRAISATEGLIARSDYPHIERRTW